MVTTIEVVTFVDATPSTVFDLTRDMDVHSSSLSQSHEIASTDSGRRRLELGDAVTFRARHFAIAWRLTSRITAYDRPERFVDEQVRGPFRSMRHEHLFEEVGDRTRMVDRMSVALPGGPIGTALARIVVAPYLRRLLRQRAHYLRRLADRGMAP